MDQIFLPRLHSFAMDNIFTGSKGDFRFRIVPNVVKPKGQKEIIFEESSMLAQFWHGPFCFEKSEMEGEKTFPLSEEGRLEMLKWLEENV
jgi:hypothetical protein